MASTNQSPFYLKAEENYLKAKTDAERAKFMEEMIRECPKHKGAETMLSNLKNRYRKLLEKIEIKKKSGKSTKQGIKKQDLQAVIVGLTNSGKSSLFNLLTGLNSKTSNFPYTTTSPALGTSNYQDVKLNLIDLPSFPHTETSIVNSADTLLVVLENLEQLKSLESFLAKSQGKKIFIFNKSDLLDEQQKRKLASSLQSKKLNFIMFSTINPSVPEITELKKKIFESFPNIRIYTKEPKKPASQIPMIMPQGSTVTNTAEKILKGFSKRIKQTKIWGPSSKFPGQVVGLEHILKDKDIIEFQTN